MLGGLFLCYEGFEKVYHKFFHKKSEEAEQAQHVAAVADPEQDLVALEKAKIKGAIRTDFILSAEIIVISLGTVATAALGVRLGVLTAISALMTVGVYGLVAGIVKIDDLGVLLSRRPGFKGLGRAILIAAPWLMTFLSIAGTAAMFLVGGDIIAHGIPSIEHAIADAAKVASGFGGTLIKMALAGVLGVIAGGLVVLLVNGFKKARAAF